MLRDATPADFAAILDLNEAFVAVLSPLDGERLARLHAQAALHRVIEEDGRVEAFVLALRQAVPFITCEFDIVPPNPVSARFHAKLGFHEVGRQQPGGGSKTVSLQALDVAAGNPLLGNVDVD